MNETQKEENSSETNELKRNIDVVDINSVSFDFSKFIQVYKCNNYQVFSTQETRCDHFCVARKKLYQSESYDEK